MKNLNDDLDLKTIVLSNPSSYKILEKYNLDYCCNGNKTLKEACQEKSLDYSRILKEIKSYKSKQDETDPNSLSLIKLADLIEKTHHQFIKSEIPEISVLLEKAAKHHKTPNLAVLKNLFETLADEMTQHMEKEEKMLFPAIRELEERGQIRNFACFDKSANPLATIADPIKQMEAEHVSAGDILEKINEIIDEKDFSVCTSLELLRKKLKALQVDLHRHIHKENYILFPKAIVLESSSL